MVSKLSVDITKFEVIDLLMLVEFQPSWFAISEPKRPDLLAT